MIDTLLYLIFALSALLLTVVILIQEGRGGGLGDAFGGGGQQVFGPGARGITRFTAWVGVVFVATALIITLKAKSDSGSVVPGETVAPLGGPGLPTDTPTPGGGG